MEKTISCIGSGNMGTALMKGISKIVSPNNIGFSDVNISKAEASAASVGAKVFASNSQAVEKADYVFLAMKPQILKSVLIEISPVIKERLGANKPGSGAKPIALVSMAAGWPIAKIIDCLGVDVPVARIMPNTPALISRGIISLSTSGSFSAEGSAELEKILAGAGLVDRLEEHYMDSATGLSGTGPAFVYIFIEALADGGVRAGLPRDKALLYATQTVLGAAAMALESGKHLGELRDMVTSPGGTAIAGITALENGAFRAAVINAVEAAWRRSSELCSADL
jgi:pyrroline-5-carboxylate reductase